MSEEKIEERIRKHIKAGFQMDYDRMDKLVNVFKDEDVVENILFDVKEYAKQKAVEFANFCGETFHSIRGDKGWMLVDAPFTKYTDDEAYFLYQQSKNTNHE